jgi:hypothetical protein
MMPRTRQQGAALLLLLAVLTLGGTWYLVSSLRSASANRIAAERQSNAAVLNQAKQALIGYVAHQAAISGEDNPGAFPCPEAPGSFNSAAGTDGRTQTPSCTLPAVGRFPWRTIGSEKFVDAAGEPLWYVVAAGWSKPGPASTDNTIINSNCADAGSAMTCWTGQLTVDGQPNAAVALIIAPGLAFNVPAAAGCTAWSQVRPAAGAPDWRNYFECENATNPADATFVSSGPSASFNDQLVKITAAEVLPPIEAAIADRFQREMAADFRSAYSIAAWGGTTVLPFALSFANPAAAASYAPGVTHSTQGLLPVSYSETALNSGAPCTPSAAAPRCQPAFVAFTNGAVTGPTVTSSSCAVVPVGPTNFTRLDCTFKYTYSIFAPPANVSFTLQATAANAGAALRRFNTAAVMTNVNAAGRTASGILNADGSATITLNGTAPLAPVGGGGIGDLLCGIAGLLNQFLFDCYQQSISVPIFLLADHPLVDATNATYGWFLRNKWHEVSYYAVAPTIAPSAAPPRSCITGATCLQVNYHLDNNRQPDDGKQRGLIVIAGPKLGTQARPATVVSDLLEGANADGVSPFEVRSATLKINRSFNDHFAVVDSNP